ncbi:MAG: T9SS type A sorting domain-containing protein [Bacteroidia bacterium]
MKRFFLATALFYSLCSNAQNRNNNWCFGDSAGINFSNIMQPAPFHSSIKSRGSCVSISDMSSNLLFYAYTRATLPGNTTLIKNNNNDLMLNGSNIVGRGWYMELIIIPDPGDTNKYYLFSVGVTSIFGLYYTTIDMGLDSGLGAVVQKNIQLLPDQANDGLIAIKHGNGRDWWVLFRNFGATFNNSFYKFLISPSGISGPFIQNIGTVLNSGFQRFAFNKTGDKLAMVMYDGLIETYDFDRCTGLLSNVATISAQFGPMDDLWSCAFSPNGRFLYVSSTGFPTTSYIFQIDLQNSTSSALDTVWSFSTWTLAVGALKLAPDDKIYAATTYYDGGGTVPGYPYADTVYNPYNMNLSVINSPDSLDSLCDFQPWSFYLGGYRTYWGLPNNSDYDMPRLQGSPCDTVQWVGVQNLPPPKGEMFVTYVSDWQKLFVNAQNIKGKIAVVRIYDLNGRVVFSTSRKTLPPYYTQDVDCSGFANGMYVVLLTTEKERFVKKFVKN